MYDKIDVGDKRRSRKMKRKEYCAHARRVVSVKLGFFSLLTQTNGLENILSPRVRYAKSTCASPSPSITSMKREIRINSTRGRFTSSTMIKSTAVMRGRKNAVRYGYTQETLRGELKMKRLR